MRLQRRGLTAGLLTACTLAMIVMAVITPNFIAAETSYFERLKPYVAEYNDNIDQIPRLIRWKFANQRINVHIVDGEEAEIIGLVTSRRAEITAYIDGGVEDPTLNAFINAETVDDVLANPTRAGLLDLIRGLRLQGVGFRPQVRVAAFGLAVALFVR